MSASLMMTHLLLEQLRRNPLPRIPEPAAVMTDAEQVSAFMDSGRRDGVLHYLYLFHALMSLPQIRPGDVVLDLACGPANQLLQLARLHPDSRFVGLDASPAMLQLAADNLHAAGVDNVSLQQGDITELDGFADCTVDVALCTMSLHHLPDVSALQQTLAQVRRVLRPDGGVYLADFGRLKRRATQHYFAHDRSEMQSVQFTADFLNSMQAAFSLVELKHAARALGMVLDSYHTALAPFMVVLRGPARREIDAGMRQRVQAAYRQLGRCEQRDLHNLLRWFRPGGLSLPAGLLLTDE